jgi:hypothetical protein
VTLIRIAIAYAAVAALFVGVAWAAGHRERGNAVAAAAEALVLTLLGALWFASLGSGGWVPVFLLLGVLASGVWNPPRAGAGRGRPAPWLRVTVIAAIRYVAAGYLLFLIIG